MFSKAEAVQVCPDELRPASSLKLKKEKKQKTPTGSSTELPELKINVTNKERNTQPELMITRPFGSYHLCTILIANI